MIDLHLESNFIFSLGTDKSSMQDCSQEIRQEISSVYGGDRGGPPLEKCLENVERISRDLTSFKNMNQFQKAQRVPNDRRSSKCLNGLQETQ